MNRIVVEFFVAPDWQPPASFSLFFPLFVSSPLSAVSATPRSPKTSQILPRPQSAVNVELSRIFISARSRERVNCRKVDSPLNVPIIESAGNTCSSIIHSNAARGRNVAGARLPRYILKLEMINGGRADNGVRARIDNRINYETARATDGSLRRRGVIYSRCLKYLSKFPDVAINLIDETNECVKIY